MSAKATAWAWEQNVTGLTKLVLLTLADVANQEGQTWYTRKHLAEKATVSLPTLVRSLDALEELGLIGREHRYRDDGSLTSSLYKLSLASVCQEPGGITQTPGSVQETHQESNSESNNDPTTLKSSAHKGKPDVEKLIAEFAGIFDEDTARGHIEDAMGYATAKKWTDKTRYCRNWLRRAAERVINGTTGTQAVRNNGSTGQGYTQGAVQRPSSRAADAEYWKGVRAAQQAGRPLT